MKKKLIIIFLVLALIFSLLYVKIATGNGLIETTTKTTILSTDSTNILPNSNFNLKIDVSKINYTKFRIELFSNINLGTPSLDISEKLESTLDESNNIFEITATKSDLLTNTLTLNYTVPKTLTTGNSIQFVVNIYSLEEITDDSTIDGSDENTVLEDSITLNIIQNSTIDTDPNNNPNNNNPNTDSNNSNNPSDKNNQNMNDIPNNNNNDNNSQKPNTNIDTQLQNSSMQISNSNSLTTNKTNPSTTQMSDSISTTSSSATQTVTYNGSSNNYLDSLSIEGFSFSKDFSKTCTTYFANVPSNTSSVTINATTEESSATYCVYGNTNLNSGTNKILITTTAEDGNTRTYRIYVNVQ